MIPCCQVGLTVNRSHSCPIMWLSESLEPQLFVSLRDQRLRHILLAYKHVGQGAIIDISAMRHDANRAVAQQFFQPPLGRRAVELAHLRRIHPAKPDALASDTDGIAIDCAHV